jgi:cell wall-associated NlpC family hydrolase
MPPRFRSLLLAFALPAIAFVCAATLPRPLPARLTAGLWLPGGLENAAAAVARPKPKRQASKRGVARLIVGERSVTLTLELDRLKRKRTAAVHAKPTLGERAATMALKAVGVPYRWGGSSLTSGFDCSGLVYWAYGRLGIELPHSSYALYHQGRRVASSRLKAGDVLFFSGLGHVGLYVGRGRMVHAPRSGRLVEVVSLGRPEYGGRLVAARRVGPA